MKVTAALLGILALEGAQAFTNSKPAFSRSYLTQCSGNVDGKDTVGDFKPLNNMVLVQLPDAKEETEGGLVLTGKSKIEKNIGTIVAAGPGRTNQATGVLIPLDVEEGDSVTFGSFQGTELEYNGKQCILIRDEDIQTKYKGELSLDTVAVVKENVLVEVDISAEEETSSGLLIAKSTIGGGSKPTIGKVVKLGPGTMANNGDMIDMEVAEGDMVKYRDFQNSGFKIGEKAYMVVHASNILAKF